MTCIVCEKRPARNGGLCHNCQQKVESDKGKRKAEKPVKFVTYRGHVVGFYRNGGGKLVPRLLKRKPEGLPKYMTIDLNHYIEGFTREQVKKLKAAVLQLANAQ